MVHPNTTKFERFLLMATIVVMPLQSYFMTIKGVSALFMVFCILGAYVLLWRKRILAIVSMHPVFLAAYAFLAVGLLMEYAHGSSGYIELIRIAFMVLGGMFIAALCRDRQGLLVSLYGFLLASVWVSCLLYFTSYGLLNSAKFTDFHEADRFRSKVLEEKDPLTGDRNDMAFYAGRGVLIALVLSLTTRKPVLRATFLTVGAFCLVGTFLPMSRSGLVMCIVSGFAILYAYGMMRQKVIVPVVCLVLAVLVGVPESVYSRFSFSMESQPAHLEDSRGRIYKAAVSHFPDYALVGVGISDYYGKWGERHDGFTRPSNGEVIGTHNCFVQVTVYWGVAGLLALIILYWQAYRYFPRPCGMDILRLGLLGILISIMMYSLVVHTLYAKEFSLALGLLVGSARWIWPYPVPHSV